MIAPHANWRIVVSVGKIIALILVAMLALEIELHANGSVPPEDWVRIFLALI